LLDAAHVLPILFPFTTPGKYCYRAMALFFKHVTNTSQDLLSPTVLTSSGVPTAADYALATSPTSLTPNKELQIPLPKSRSRSLTSGISRVTSNLRRHSSLRPRPPMQDASGLTATVADTSASTSGQATPRFQDLSGELVDDAGQRVGGKSDTYTSEVSAGEAKVYEGDWVIFRVSSSNSFFLLRWTKG
jgi:hypothetical protein